jgi:hypothetical protein
LVAACGGDDAGPPVMVRDSAGVEIVHNRAGAWGGGSGWRISAEPDLSLGVVDGPDELQFTEVRNAFALDDGRIVIANRRHPPELRVFAPDGQHLVSMGGAGDGPGEFGFIQWAESYGDTITAFDAGAMRLTTFTADGHFVETVMVGGPALRPHEHVVWGRLGGSGLLTSDNRIVPPDVRGRGRADFTLLRFTPDRAASDTLLALPGWEYDAPRPQEARPLHFGLRAVFLAHGDRLYVGAGDAFRIDVHNLDGRHLRSIRMDLPRRPVHERDLDALFAERLERARNDEEAQRMREGLAALPVADLMPAHGSLLIVDRTGHLWVQGAPAPTDPVRPWHVFDPDGRYLGPVELPARLRVTDIGDRTLLGVWRDEYGVESVRRYAIVKDDA